MNGTHTTAVNVITVVALAEGDGNIDHAATLNLKHL